MSTPRFCPPVLHVFLAALGLGCLLTSCTTSTVSNSISPGDAATTERVGRSGPGRAVTPVNQVLTPLGRTVELPGLRPQALALSPDGRVLLASGKTSELIVLDPATGVIRQRVALPNEAQGEPQPDVVSPNILEPDKKGQVSFTGLVFAPDGRRIFLSNVNGSIKVFAVAPDGTVTPSHSLPLPPANALRRKEEIPSGLALSADGARLYVCANLSNQLLELDAVSGKVLRAFPVGVAPYDVRLVAGKAYVSNWGGRRPGAGDLTGPAGRGTVVRVDAEKHIASEGSVSVIPLAANSPVPIRELLTGLHASALAVSPNGRYVVCANAAADNLSVIDTRSDTVVETIWAKAKPSDLFGASPNALVFEPSGRRLYVANGTQNAVAVVKFDPSDRESKLEGLIPVGWFPGALLFDAPRATIVVANIKGLPDPSQRTSANGAKGTNAPTGFNSKQYAGSLSLVPVPASRDLPKLSETVARNLRREAIAEARLPARPGQPARAIPERIGEPSRIKHVVYIIKENRTYDQVFGDLKEGNGDPSLCIFGEAITPNQHKLVRDFVLLDNTYCAGILSADGHQWSTTAFSTDYMEKSFAGFPRSYPDGMGVDDDDALAYSPAGFIWDNAVKHKVSIRNYGEFMAPSVTWRDGRKGTPDFLACYRTWKGASTEAVFTSYPMIETIKGFSPTAYVGWEMSVPDQYRADFFLRELKEFEARGQFPAFTIICLPNDHTSGTKKGAPTPAACMADNDLAFARIIEGLSHSPFWKEMAIFGIEDDPQAGWDHVSGYRTTAYVVSPFAKRKSVVSTQYNTTSVIRTIEQILGLPVMNQFDASATPMADCFTETPDFTPFKALPANVPLDQMNPDPVAITDPILRRDAVASARMNFREVDKAPEDQLNRILWRAMKGSQVPYPEWAITPDSDD
ncbi:bifunctional YncE family protein/alkaline phosphatase family protein [Horticoccus sp. 23ND18S-11]|uniref:bifunctional YncE family protein/alkaline phosphatase family protein n=1 Tax=Horticoccus sp. 23ND18S-11 TaxID=3391832 RepID=UPI0039C927BE